LSVVHTTWKTQRFAKKLKKDLETITSLVWEDKTNPHDIENLLDDFSNNTSQFEASIQRDEAEYREYLGYINLAEKKWGGYEKLLQTVSRDDHPDSKEVEKFFSNADNIERELKKLWGFTEEMVTDWYKLTDRLEDVIKRCDYNTRFIHKESQERDSTFSEMSSAARQIKKAKRWSWRYVSISSSVWDRSLRKAHEYYEKWDFSRALDAANSAKSIAINAISDAEDADRREQRRRDEERRRKEEARRAAARAAAAAKRRAAERRAAARRRSSSSSSISFGWGSSGGSWFSGWRM